MFNKFERQIAFRYLKSPRQEGFVSVIAGFSFIGIALGVAILIIVMSVMNGFQKELYDKLIGMKGHVICVKKNTSDFELDQSFIKKISTDNNIKHVYPVLEKQCILNFNASNKGIVVYGLFKNDILKKDIINNQLLRGSLKNFNKNTIAIGCTLANSINAKVGDYIDLILPNGNITPFGTMPKQKQFLVVAMFETGMHEFDKNIAILTIQDAMDFFNEQNRISHIDIILNDINNSDKVLRNLQKTTNQYFFSDWKKSDFQIFKAVEIEKNVMFLILTLIILIAAFNVISSLMMLVKDKTKDIAIMKTMGATKNNILKIFFLTGSSIGIFGTLLGLLLGVSLSLNIESIKNFLQKFSDYDLFNAEVYFLSQLPSKLVWNEVFIVCAIAIFLTILATIYPSYKASKLEIAAALRI